MRNLRVGIRKQGQPTVAGRTRPPLSGGLRRGFKARKYMREYQRARRERLQLKPVQIELTAHQRRFLARCRRESSQAEHVFNRKALLVGAAMLFNAGSVRGGGKVRVRPPSPMLRRGRAAGGGNPNAKAENETAES